MARPRSQAAHEAAIDAAVDILLESGADAVTFDEVSARSGVARSTLYRHFGTKEALLIKAAGSCILQHTTPDTGSLESDLRELFDHYDTADATRQIPNLLPTLLDAAARNPEVERLVRELLEERRRPLRTVLRLAQGRGEIDPDLDLEVAVALLLGPITHRKMVDRGEVTPQFRRQVLELAIGALRATAPAPART